MADVPYTDILETTVNVLEEGENRIEDEHQLIYVCIAKKSYTLAEASNMNNGDIQEYIVNVMDRLHEICDTDRYVREGEMSCGFLVERFAFTGSKNMNIYICVCDPFYRPKHDTAMPFCFISVAHRKCSLVQAYGMLQDTISVFHNMFKDCPGIPQRGSYLSANSDIAPKLFELLALWNKGGHENPNITKIKEEIRHVKDVMLANIDSLIDRSDNIESLITQTDRLEQHSKSFQATSKKVHNKEWWRANKYYCYIICIGSIIVLWVLGPLLRIVYHYVRG